MAPIKPTEAEEALTIAEWQARSGQWIARFPGDDLLQRGLVSGEEAAEVLEAAMELVKAVGKAQRAILKAHQDIRGGTEHWMAQLQLEAADAFFCLTSIAQRAGFSLGDAIAAKWALIKDREYVRGPS